MLADIVEPAAPVAQAAGATAWIVLLAGVAAALVAAWWWRGRQRRRAARQLAGLRRAFRAGQLTGREAAYRLAALLQGRVRLGRLAADAPPAGWRECGPADWKVFVLRLDLLRYRPDGTDDAESIEALFSQAGAWLRHHG